MYVYNDEDNAPMIDEAWEAAREKAAQKQQNAIEGLADVLGLTGDCRKCAEFTDLAEGLGKDRAGIQFCAQLGADGIISTRANLIRAARDLGLLTVQRFFALDSQGVDSIQELLDHSCPDLMEIMPGVIGKIIKRFSNAKAPLIAGGLVETKDDVTTALKLGAFAVSTGIEDLWYI